MRCLVTGATGHLGSYLTRLLVSKGEEVTVLVRPTSNLWRLEGIFNQINLLYGDLENIHPAREQIIKTSPEITFHLAWFGVTGEYRNDDKQILNNVIGSLNLFHIIQEAGCRCWIGLGSQAEYGPYPNILSEDLPLKPVTAYGVSKLSVGVLTQKLCELAKIRYVWLRLLATYGPKDDEKHLIPSIILKLLAGEKPSLTPGEQKWDYLYVEDAAEAIYKTALTPHVNGTFNLASGNSYSIQEVAETIRNLIDPSLKLGFGDIAYQINQIMCLTANISKIQSATGWSPSTDLKKGLKNTIHWFSEFSSH